MSREMAARSEGMKQSVAAVLSYVRSSDAALVMLLGRSYSLDDIVFYTAGICAVVSAGAWAPTRPARLPLAGRSPIPGLVCNMQCLLLRGLNRSLPLSGLLAMTMALERTSSGYLRDRISGELGAKQVSH